MIEYYNFGKKHLGPLLYGFSSWLYENITREKINRIYFFSRDGYIMKKAFDMLFSHESIKTYYLEVSRRSLRVPILWKDYSFENLLTMLGPSQLISMQSIFDSVGLSIDDYEELLKKYHFSIDSYFYRKDMLSDLDLLAMYNELGHDIYHNSKKEYESLKKYIRQNDLKGKFAIVDIGWSGGMQRYLQTTLKEMSIDADIYGYYTGIADYYTRNYTNDISLKLNGYLFDFSHNPKDEDGRSCFVGLYEMLFLEAKGSVRKYVVNNEGCVYAERYEHEYCIDGIYLEEIKYIKEVQRGALSYIEENKKIKTIDKNSLCNPLLKVGQQPTKQVIKLFAKFRFFDEGEYMYLAVPRNCFYYIKYPQMFKRDFIKSRWKTAFLKQIFKLPLPYYFIYKYLKRLQNNAK